MTDRVTREPRIDALSAVILAIHDVDCDFGTDCTEPVDRFGRYGRYARAALTALGIDPATPVSIADRRRLADLGARAAAVVEQQHQEADELRRRIRP